jgi:hypothetical protein
LTGGNTPSLMKKPSFSATVAMLACLGIATSMAFAGASPRKVFGKENPFRAEELPAGKLKTKLQSLDPQAKEKAMKWLHTFDFDATDAAEHLRVDHGGGIYIVCPDDHGNCEGHSRGPAMPEEPTDNSSTTGSIAPEPGQPTEPPPTATAAVLVSAPPAYHSRPGATRRVYLDFNGGIVSGTAWNTSEGVSSWDVKVWSQDADRTTFNDSEQAWMKRVWQRVAEDYAPFDVDVTTDTAYDPDNYTGNKDYVGWLLICESTDNNGVALPHSGSGGVAYVGVFGNSTYSPNYQPAWVNSTNGGGSESIIAEAASHEMGHNMGLSHDGTSTLAYYGGHGSGDISWGPIMGTGYNRNISQWCKGEYYNASQLQDDLTIISNRVAYRADDHGNTAGTATPLTITSGTTISSTTPENDPSNSSPTNKGLIGRNTDVDVFSFYTGAGTVQLNANPWIQPSGTRGGNLDLLLELYNAAGTLVASNNAANLTSATISTTLTQGYYYLHLRNTGTGTPLVSPPSGYTAYGSIGQYFISGTIVDANPPLALAGVTPASGNSGSIVIVDVTGTGMSANTTVKLTKTGQADITATSVQLVGSSLRCQINLTGAAAGTWDVVATNPDLQSSTLPDAFAVIGVIWSQNFDGTVSDWTSSATAGSNSWSLVTTQSHSPASSYFAPAIVSKSTTNLTSPSIPIPAGATSMQLKFWHSFNLQSTKDAGKLELSVDGAAWFDVEDSGSGAVFASNGYNSTVKSKGRPGTTNEFDGKPTWSGNSNGFIETLVNLTNNTKYAGHSLRMRWRLATDNSIASPGWYVDSIALLANADITNQPPQITAAASTSSAESETDPDTTTYQIIRGTGTNLSVTATDDGGEPALTYTWSVTSGPAAPVILSENASNAAKNTTAIFETTGDYRISVSVTDGAGLAVTSAVDVRVYQNADSLEVLPLDATVQFGKNQQFSASLLDQFGAPMASQPSSFAWSASGGGTINSDGLFSATAAGGPFVITAQSGAFSNTTSVTVTPAPASIVLSDLNQTYNGSPKHVTVVTTPINLSHSVTYNSLSDEPVNAATYAVEVNITDPNYQGTASDSLVIAKASQTIDFTPLTAATFGDEPITPSATATSALTVSYTSSDPSIATASGNTVTIVGAGNTTITASQAGDDNYEAAIDAPQLLTVNKATTAVTLSGLTQTYDGSPKHVTVTTDPAVPAENIAITYEGLPDEPTAVGTYAIVATINDPNHEGGTTGSLVIEPGLDLVSWKNEHFTETEQIAGLAANNEDPDLDGLFNLAEYALGTDPWVFTPPLVPTLDANGLTLTFTRPAGLPDVTYFAETSEELQAWSPILLELIAPGDPETVRARDPLNTGDPSKRFMRLRFETP